MKVKFFPFYGFSVLPMGVLYVLSDLAFIILYYLLKYRRKVVLNNLRRSFVDKTEMEIKNIEKKFYQHFCDVMFETIKALTISEKEIAKRIHFKNLDVLERCYDEKRNIILYAAHQGNWEWLSFLPIVQPYKCITLYQPLSNKYFDDLMKTIRERFGTQCIEAKKGYRTMLKFTQNDPLTMTGLIGDQSPGRNGIKCWLNFLNQKTAFLMGADRIVKSTNQIAIFPAFKKKIGDFTN